MARGLKDPAFARWAALPRHAGNNGKQRVNCPIETLSYDRYTWRANADNDSNVNRILFSNALYWQLTIRLPCR